MRVLELWARSAGGRWGQDCTGLEEPCRGRGLTTRAHDGEDGRATQQPGPSLRDMGGRGVSVFWIRCWLGALASG